MIENIIIFIIDKCIGSNPIESTKTKKIIMIINASLCNGTYDFNIELDEYKPDNFSVFQVTLGDQILIIDREEWRQINELVTNSMDFVDSMSDY